MIDEVLPAGVAAAESRDGASPEALFAQERALVAGAVEKRRREFAAARLCARRALTALDLPPAPILRGPQREPIWPAGVVGSITHCAGYAAGAVAPAARFCTLGIDAELDAPLPNGVLEFVSLPDEREALGGGPTSHPDRVLFSAKESVYKAWFPLARRWLGFHDALIDLSPDGTFAVRLLVPGPLSELSGRWLVRDGLVLTAIAVPESRARAAHRASPLESDGA